MRVLMLTQYFPPEIGATQTRLDTFAAGLARRGHDVEVVCEVPNHPQGIVREGYGRRFVESRRRDGFVTRYVWVRTAPVKTTAARLAFYGSYAAMATAVGSITRRPDVVFASSPPLPVAAAASLVAVRHRVPWVMDVRDLWPEAAVAMGELRPGNALRVAAALEGALYRSATAITAVTGPFRDSIARMADASKIHLLPNGTTRFWLEGSEVSADRGGLGLPEDRFLWTYAGNVGGAQGLEVAIDAAKRLGDGFQLLILGDGPVRYSLERRAGGAPPGSIVFRDQVSQVEARLHLRSSDALLVPLASDPALASFVPSKLFDCCAVGRPVIVSAAGEPQRLVREAAAALAVPPGDAEALAGAVERLAAEGVLRQRLGVAGAAFAAEHLRERHTATLERVLAAAYRGPTGSIPSAARVIRDAGG